MEAEGPVSHPAALLNGGSGWRRTHIDGARLRGGVALVARELNVEAEKPARVEAVRARELARPRARRERAGGALLPRAPLAHEPQADLVRLHGPAQRDALADGLAR